ncbi:hypothetical protein [Rubellicoccus peritrichatus]|uniref:Uncharacterized protein n=1 Tax=Rubellicoccus peritrichatus TaxID=3080537 RepID=A0AAQ3QUY9_9BACT|nr:hypothetical protein [Puniceicoccus sp. CR14]WOO40953.1 hypothetical protein RZN69_20220 [Puniceicoccus sp. CR14]
MTEKALRRWLAQENAEDSWSVAVNGTIIDGMYSLEAIFELPEVIKGADLQLLHKSKVGHAEPPWVRMEIASKMSESQRERFELAKKEGEASFHWAFLIQVVVVFIILGGALAYVFWPEEEIETAPEDPMERMITKLETVRTQRAEEGIETDSMPSLKVSVGTSGRIVFVSNLSEESWPSCELIINDTYRYLWDEEIVAGRTLHAPLRSFMGDNGSLDVEETPPEQVAVVVPGFRVWKDRFK